MAIKIDRKHFELIKAYAVAAYPNECCGFLLGRPQNGNKEVLRTFPAANAREGSEQYHRFLITPELFLQCEKFARERNLDIVGFYHSHPNAEARPSEYDIEHGWPWYSYVIVSVKDGKAKDVTSWILEEDRSGFRQEKIDIKATKEPETNNAITQ